MNETNPYSAPQADVSTNDAITDRLQSLDFKQLKKLYHRSSNVNVITWFLGFGIIGLVVMSILPDARYTSSMKYIFVGFAIFYAVAILGLYRRTAWGRILGILACIISLISIPIGTLIGAFGLFAFIRAPELFGSNRITHKEVKAEFKLQKANMKKR